MKEQVHHCPDHRLDEDDVEVRLGRFGKYFDIVPEPNDLPITDVTEIHVGERENNVVKERIDNDADKDDQRRCDEKENEYPLSQRCIHIIRSFL
jgi:hypothetical protein